MDAPPTFLDDAGAAAFSGPGGSSALQVDQRMMQAPAAMPQGGGWAGVEGGGLRGAQTSHLDGAVAFQPSIQQPSDFQAHQFQGQASAPHPSAYPPLHAHVHPSAQAGMLPYQPPPSAHVPPQYHGYVQPLMYGFPPYHAPSAHAPSPFPASMPPYSMPLPHPHTPGMYPPPPANSATAAPLSMALHSHAPTTQPQSPGSAQHHQRPGDATMATPAGAPFAAAGLGPVVGTNSAAGRALPHPPDPHATAATSSAPSAPRSPQSRRAAGAGVAADGREPEPASAGNAGSGSYFREGPEGGAAGRAQGRGRVVRGLGGYQYEGDEEGERKEKARLELQESLRQQVPWCRV